MIVPVEMAGRVIVDFVDGESFQSKATSITDANSIIIRLFD